MWLKLLIALSLFSFSHCITTPKDPGNFHSGPLNGVINGQEWVYKFAYTDPTVATPDEDDMFFVFLPFTPSKPCSKELAPSPGQADDGRRVTMAVPLKKKLLKMKGKGSHNLIFEYVGDSSQHVTLNIKKGKVLLTKITESDIEGKIYARSTNGTWVSGEFKAQVCNSLDMR